MITFADLLTPGGIATAAVGIVTLVQIIKTAFPPIDDRISGASMAFVLSALLYVAAAFVLSAPGPDAYLGVLASWILAASAAMGIKSGADHIDAVRTGTAGVPLVPLVPVSDPVPTPIPPGA